MRTFRGYLGILVSSAALLFSYISTAPFVLQGVFEFSELEFAATFGAVGLGLLLTSLATARLLRRRHPRSVIRSAQLIQLAGVLLLALVIFVDVGTGWSHPVLLVASLAVAVVPCGAIGPCCTALAMAESGQRAGSASALLGVGMFLAGGLVSPLSGNGHPAIIMVALMLIAVVTGPMLGSLTARRR